MTYRSFTSVSSEFMIDLICEMSIDTLEKDIHSSIAYVLPLSGSR